MRTCNIALLTHLSKGKRSGYQPLDFLLVQYYAAPHRKQGKGEVNVTMAQKAKGGKKKTSKKSQGSK